MKTIFQYITLFGFSIALCLFSILPAHAQHHGGGGHLGGGGHFSGGGRGFSGGSHAYGNGTFSHGGMAGHHSAALAGRSFAGGHTVNAFRGSRSYASRGYVRGYGHAGFRGIGSRGGYFYSRGFYRSLYYPCIGLSFGYLPYECYPFYWDNYPYYFSDGFYYQYNNDQYTVVEPPVGASIKTLPSNAQSIVINGQQYYEQNGVYYAPVTQPDGTIVYQIAGKDGQLNTTAGGTAVVAAPKIGDITATLPPDSRQISLNGKIYYVSADGIYYQETTDSSNNKVYKIVGLESGPNTN